MEAKHTRDFDMNLKAQEKTVQILLTSMRPPSVTGVVELSLEGTHRERISTKT